jgi:molybdopterin-guanine dinucleotide biosynthesis protein A
MTNSDRSARVGGIVLAGGASSRLGQDKALLDWHGTPLWERVARLLERGLGGGPVAVVGELPGPQTRFVEAHDPFADGGPLVGMLAGMLELRGSCDAAVVVPCDVPLLHPTVVRALARSLAAGDFDVAAPSSTDGRLLPIPGAWNMRVVDSLIEAVDGDERSPARFAAGLRAANLPIAGLAADPEVQQSDPELDSLRDIDTAADLDALRQSAPKVRIARGTKLETPAAWTLGELADQSGGDPEGPCVVNGLPVEFDRAMPLARRDAVSMPPALPV